MKHTADCHATPTKEESIRNPIMKISLKPYRAFICAALATFGLATAHAQTTANWIGPATGGEWNTPANWDTGFPPLDSTTNASIAKGTNVSYNLPMAATSIGTVFNSGILNINTNGFNSGAVTVNAAGGGAALFVGSNGVMNVTGNFGFCSNAIVTLAAGSSVSISGTLYVGSNPFGASGSSTAGAAGCITNNGGTLTATATALNVNNATITLTNRFMINGGINNLGAYSEQRSPGGAGAPPALGTAGLVVSNGFVNTTSISVGNNAHGIVFVAGGIFTNTGNVRLTNNTLTRPARLLQTGGLFVTIDPSVVIMQGNADSVYAVLGGTNIIGGLQFNGTTNYVTNAAPIYIGSSGIMSNGAATLITALLNNNGKFGATTDWTNNAPITLNGGSFDAQGLDGTPHNIYSVGLFRGTGPLIKTGGGTLTLASPNTYSGITFVKNGTLALAMDPSGSVGSIASGNISVGTGATFDVSQLTGYSLNALQTLGGFGTINGSVAVAATGVINPGSNLITGTLTFNNDITETGGAINHFDVPGDAISLAGALNLSGSNIVEIAGTVPPGTPYALFHYGTLIGDVSNFGLSGAAGTLSNSVTDKIIYLVPASGLRGTTNVTWVGNSVVNDWDTQNLTNWVDGGTSPLDFFLSGDKARFDNLAGTNTNVNIPGTVSPGSIVVDSTSNYVFSGVGLIAGPTASLTKTNSGNLTILTTNTYAGVTTLAGGVVDVLTVANGSVPSPLGSAPADPSALVFNGGTLEYLGGNKTIDRGATFQTGGAVLSITNGTTLTTSGTLTGPGSLTKIGNGQLTLSSPNDFQGGTLITAGTIRVAQGSGATISTLGTNVITLNGNASAATLQFGGDAEVLNNTLNIVNTNNFMTNGGNDQVLNVIGNGLVNLEGTGANVTTFAGDMTAFTGIIYVDTLPNARFLPNSGSVSGGTNVTFNLGTGSGLMNNRNGNLTVLLGSLFGGPNTVAQGGSTSSSDNRATTYIIGGNNSSSEFDGKFAESTAIRKVSLVKAGTGTFTLTAANPYTGFTTISNGVLALAFGTNTSTDGSLDNTTNIEIAASGILDVSTRSDGTLNLGGSQILAGSGTLRGSLNASGTVAPDGGTANTTATLTVTNVASLANLTWMKLNRGSTPNSDKLVAPTINLGGNLVITNSGAPLHAGDTFTLFSGTLAGSFGGITTPNYSVLDTTQLSAGGNGTVTVLSYTPPVMKADYSAFSTGTITFNISGGIVGNGVSILSSTNIALPIASWTNAATGNFDGSGNFSAPVTIDPSVPQQYFIMQTQ